MKRTEVTLPEVIVSMSTNNIFLGGVAPLSTARSVRESAGFMSSIKKEDRSSLTANNKLKLKEAAIAGLEDKYDLLDSANTTDMDSLKNVYSISIKNEELKASFRQFDMIDVMTCPDVMVLDSSGEPEPGATANPINLFNNVMEVRLETIKEVDDGLRPAISRGKLILDRQ